MHLCRSQTSLESEPVETHIFVTYLILEGKHDRTPEMENHRETMDKEFLVSLLSGFPLAHLS